MLSIFIFALTSILIILGFLLYPRLNIGKYSFQSFWVVALIGATLMVLTGQVNLKEVIDNLLSPTPMNPIKLVVLFLSMTVLSIYLDEVGFFSYVAILVLRKSGTSQWKVFFSLYFLVAILTLFTSNDIIVLTLTLFIIYFAKRANINPLPFLISQFVAANTASIAFIIGNPTNMYLSSIVNLSFIEYFKVMALPTLGIVLSSLLILTLLFKKDLAKPIAPTDLTLPNLAPLPITVGLIHLAITIILLVLSNYIRLEMWIITLVLATSLIIFALIIKTKHQLSQTIKRMPFSFVPFLISMFILVLALSKTRVDETITNYLTSFNPIFSYGYSSALFANVINNIPMSVFYGSLVENLDPQLVLPALYASIIGSNIAAVFTPLGSLAGLMWMELLKKEGVKLNFLTFSAKGMLIGILTLSIGLSILVLMI